MARRIYPESNRICASVVTVQCPHQTCEDIGLFQESPAQVRERVVRAVSKGDFIRAIALLNRLIMDYPASAEDYNNRGLLHLWHGSPQKAILDFNRAIALNPDLPASYNNRANYYAVQGAKKSALEDYDRAIDLNPFHVRARINRAITLRELGHYDAALDGLEDALLFRQMTGEIYAERGRTYHLRGDWNCAIADYRRALAFFPSSESAAATLPRRQQLLTWLNQLNTAA